MISNLLVLIILGGALYLVCKEEKANIEKIIATRTSLEVRRNLDIAYDFWKQMVNNPVRIVCLALILVCQNGIVGMLFTLTIFLGVSYYLAKQNVLGNILWEEERTQKIATGITALLAISWLINSNDFHNAFVKVIFVIILIAVIYWFVAKKWNFKIDFSNLRKSASGANRDDYYDDYDYEEDDGHDPEDFEDD